MFILDLKFTDEDSIRPRIEENTTLIEEALPPPPPLDPSLFLLEKCRELHLQRHCVQLYDALSLDPLFKALIQKESQALLQSTLQEKTIDQLAYNNLLKTIFERTFSEYHPDKIDDIDDILADLRRLPRFGTIALYELFHGERLDSPLSF